MKLSNIKEKLKNNTSISTQLNKFLTISTTSRRLLINGIFTAVMLGLVICNTSAFFKEDVPYGTLLYILSFFISIFTGALASCKWELSPRLNKHIKRITIFILPLLSMTMVECLNGVFIGTWMPGALILNCIFYALIYLAVFALSGSYRLPFLILNPILFALSLTNHYVFAFRGTPFVPMDFLYASTAATVAGTYDFSFDYQIVTSIILLALTLTVASKIKTPPKTMFKKIITRGLAAIVAFGILISYYTSDFLADAGLAPDFFNQERAYHNSGVALNFWLNTKYLTIEEPKDYNANDIENIVSNVIKNNALSDNDTTTSVQPNIICIMNESLADLNVLGDVKTNKDYMPFLRSLKENTVRGNLYVPVIGAGTSNSEFEFLTGTTTAFLPNGSNAYTLYVKNNLQTLTTSLEKQGYSSRAFHPFFSYNWNRINVYNYMGFDQYDGMEMFFNEEIMTAYSEGSSYESLKEMIGAAFPNDTDVLTRHVVSDSFNHKKIIEMYEERDANQPFYIFNITMQNHGGYENKYPDFEEEIYLTDENGNIRDEYPKTNQYLSLVYESDKAFKELITYFETQEEPTIICMFGDHQPSIEDEYVAELLGTNSLLDLNIKQLQSRYIAPFYIWANYDIEEQKIERLSANYLSSCLVDIAGLKKTEYNEYLLALSKTLPVIDTVGYIDAKGSYYVYGQETPYTELIDGYEKICYNYLFDETNKCNWLYTLKE